MSTLSQSFLLSISIHILYIYIYTSLNVLTICLTQLNYLLNYSCTLLCPILRFLCRYVHTWWCLCPRLLRLSVLSCFFFTTIAISSKLFHWLTFSHSPLVRTLYILFPVCEVCIRSLEHHRERTSRASFAPVLKKKNNTKKNTKKTLEKTRKKYWKWPSRQIHLPSEPRFQIWLPSYYNHSNTRLKIKLKNVDFVSKSQIDRIIKW